MLSRDAGIAEGLQSMGFFRVYRRVLALLRPERGLAIGLAIANVIVASLFYVEPLLFGRIVDVLSKAPTQDQATTWE